ncbi:ALDH-like protein [Artomyces pyxidatus]|uniref:ALDH-like protein n=1 Tax=Artomyces pyxidatus TaxID=48021 RepID=A0ACB8T160_9AGAM|nr:ALDH-like protein [Artomyces pyxidatus]
MVSPLQYTPIEEIQTIHDDLGKTFRAGKARPLVWRQHQLRQVLLMLRENEAAIVASLDADLRKPVAESLFGEIALPAQRAEQTLASLEEWTKPETVTVDAWQQPWNPTIYKTPKGVVLIIATWNFPWSLVLSSLIGAIAAGCPAVLKPSEISAHCAQLMGELIPKYVDQSAYRVVNGGVKETTRLLELKWDHISYVGNSTVARIIAAAAAKHLTPLTLELGGKSPTVIDAAHTDLRLAAKRILWGKNINAGQVCIAPDYILIQRDYQDALIEALKEAYAVMEPNGALGSSTYCGIINAAHYGRLQGLMGRTTGQLVMGGKADGKKFIEPTVYKDVKGGDALMEAELFGPILPIVPVDSMQEAIEFINDRPHPLVLYVFTDDAELKQAFIDTTLSGTLEFNDVIPNVAGLPFAGVGESGYGAQNMKYTFDEFTHNRASVDIPFSTKPRMSKVWSCEANMYNILTADLSTKTERHLITELKIDGKRPRPWLDRLLTGSCRDYKGLDASSRASLSASLLPLSTCRSPLNMDLAPSLPKPDKASCAQCGISDCPLRRCGKCRAVPYCSTECQKADWKSHKTVCEVYIEDKVLRSTGVYVGEKAPKTKKGETARTRNIDRAKTHFLAVTLRRTESSDPRTLYSLVDAEVIPLSFLEEAWSTRANMRDLIPMSPRAILENDADQRRRDGGLGSVMVMSMELPKGDDRPPRDALTQINVHILQPLGVYNVHKTALSRLRSFSRDMAMKCLKNSLDGGAYSLTFQPRPL